MSEVTMERSEPDEHVTRIQGLLSLELGSRHWTLIFESDTKLGSCVLSADPMTREDVIMVLKETIAMMEKK